MLISISPGNKGAIQSTTARLPRAQALIPGQAGEPESFTSKLDRKIC